jgi:hypothetical protein
MTPPSKRSYAAGHFELAIDGHKTHAYLKSVSGGWVKGNVSDDPIGAQSGRVKQIANVEIEPMEVELGMSGATEILGWVQGSWNRKWSRRSGQITHADFNLKEAYEHWFYDALLTEVTFPALDGAAKEPAYLKCKFLPERVVTKPMSMSTDVGGVTSPKQKMWIPSAFRFSIDQFDGLEYTNKIESFTIKQGIKKMFVGRERYPQIEPTNLQFPNISGTVALAHAEKLLKWHHDYVYKEKAVKDPKGQLSGAIEFLSPDRAKPIFRIDLFGVGLSNVSIPQSTANNDQIKRAKFEMFVSDMKLDVGASGLA